MAARKPVMPSDEALQRIRDAAGSFPADQKLSDADLGWQLFEAISDYCSYLDLREIKAQRKRLKAIHKTASKLEVLLRGDEEIGFLHWYDWPKKLPPPSTVAGEIRRTAEESTLLETSPQKVIREIKDHHGVRGSPLEWLVGTRLPKVFRRLSRQDVTLYPKGNYARFAAQVLKEFEIGDVKPSTIIRAVTSAGSRSRRRGGQK
jgi:hypothetical protein